MELQISTSRGVDQTRVLDMSANETRQHDDECSTDDSASGVVAYAQAAPSQH